MDEIYVCILAARIFSEITCIIGIDLLTKEFLLTFLARKSTHRLVCLLLEFIKLFQNKYSEHNH